MRIHMGVMTPVCIAVILMDIAILHTSLMEGSIIRTNGPPMDPGCLFKVAMAIETCPEWWATDMRIVFVTLVFIDFLDI